MDKIKVKKSLFSAGQEKAIRRYAKLYPEYKKLGRELKALVKSLLIKNSLDFIDLIVRVKSGRSFREKIARKKYWNPLTDMKDLCGVRIICSFPSDVEKIEKVLKKEFRILNSADQEKNISPYKFWYRSHHFEVQLSEKQMALARYPLIKNFVAEFQVRTLFMNAWAEMEHRINYKHEWNTSHEAKRKMSRLSALLELADEQLEELAENN